VQSKIKETLLAVAWFSLAYGLLEGVGLLLVSPGALTTYSGRVKPVDASILWIAPLLDIPLFLSLGFTMHLAARLGKAVSPAFGVICSQFLTMSTGMLLVPPQMHGWSAVILGIGLTVVWSRWLRTHGETFSIILRRSLPTLAAVWLLLFGGIWGGQRYRELQNAEKAMADSSKPNVLLIVLDTARADRFSAYGYGRQTTPQIDHVAKEGILYTQAIAPSSWTVPSHASLFTGRNPEEHGAGIHALDDRFPTVAETLQGNGYRTAGFVANRMMLYGGTGLGRGFVHYEDILDSPLDAFARTVYGRRIVGRIRGWLHRFDLVGRKSAGDVNRGFLDWLDRKVSASQDISPFFAFLNYFDTHYPVFPPMKDAARFSSAPESIAHRDPQKDADFKFQPAPGEAKNWEDAYDAALNYVDGEIGNLLDDLSRRRLLENTIVVITSDHGEAFLEHGYWGHAIDLHRETIHVPLIIRFPRKISGGTVHKETIGLAEVPSLILNLLGSKAPQLRPARSGVLSYLEPNPWFPKSWPSHSGWQRSIVDGRWHFLWHEGRPAQLFDWENDRLEAKDLAGTPQGKEIVAKFTRAFD